MGIHPDKPEQTGLNYMKICLFVKRFFRVSPNMTGRMAVRTSWDSRCR